MVVVDDYFDNDESVVIEILNSTISYEYKEKYTRLNMTKIKSLERISMSKDIVNLIDILMENNMLFFSKDNILKYLEHGSEGNVKFIQFLNKNICYDNYREILTLFNNKISSNFINNYLANNDIFQYALECNPNKIEVLDKNLELDRVKLIIDNDLLIVTEENIIILLSKNYNEGILKLINCYENEVIDILCKYNKISLELVYSIINKKINIYNTIKIIDLMPASILIENIDLSNVEAIGYLMKNKVVLDNNKNLEYVMSRITDFPFNIDFLMYLYEYRQNYIDNNFINFILLDKSRNKEISIDMKIDLIILGINNNISMPNLKRLLSTIPEISELACVFDETKNKRPALNNPYKERIGKALIDKNYVRKRGKETSLLRIEK